VEVTGQNKAEHCYSWIILVLEKLMIDCSLQQLTLTAAAVVEQSPFSVLFYITSIYIREC